MKSFIGIFCATLIIPSLSLFSEIPFNHALGIYAGTKEDYKEISPFWGMVALHGGMLQNYRFYGNYQKVNNEDQGQDAIAKLIKELFPSPDGVQFVANTYKKDPIGNLSRNLTAINSIIEALEEKLSSEEKENKIRNIFSSLPLPETNRRAYRTKQGDNDKLAQLIHEFRTYPINAMKPK
jgi:hypothetical protein